MNIDLIIRQLELMKIRPKKSLLEYINGQVGVKARIVYPDGSDTGETVTVYPLAENSMEVVSSDIQFGNYRLGYLDGDVFHVKYVGRSDHNDNGLKGRLAQHVGEEIPNETYFQFMEKNSALEAYQQECKDFHDFGEKQNLRNVEHPKKLDGHTNLFCPVCGQ